MNGYTLTLAPNCNAAAFYFFSSYVLEYVTAPYFGTVHRYLEGTTVYSTYGTCRPGHLG